MKEVTPQSIKRVILSKKYLWYDDGQLNLIGIRSKNRRANQFDDLFTLTYRVDKENYKTYIYPCTTDPGSYWLKNLFNPKGAAILVPGQYVNVYALDLHRNQYEALCQRHGPVKVYRDSNKNEILDMNPETIKSGNYGINIHRAAENGVARFVELYSAGCQVFESADDFYHARNIWRISKKIYGNVFTYTLLEEKDF